jgi:hypothetical protein
MAATIIIVVSVNILGYIVLFFMLKERMRRAVSPQAQLGEVREEVNRLVIELNQTTDRNISLLEDRIAGLTELLSKADRKIAMLRRESEKHEVGARVYDRMVSSDTAQRTRTQREDVEKAAPPRGEQRAETRDTRDAVIDLYRAGLTASLISARVGAPLGEVELIISLAERERRE